MGGKPYKSRREIRLDGLTVRLNAHERQMLVALTKRLERTKSDTVRLLVREAHRALAIEEGGEVPA